jgi:hypothetical protein
MNMQPVSASFSWVSTSQGVIEWTFKNPNDVPVNFVLLRGVTQNESPPENIYLFGDAFYPLYYYDFGTQFQLGQPTPLKAAVNQPPLAMFKSPDGTIQAGFIFTIGAKGSWSMNEGGFIGIAPAGISTLIVSYSETVKFNVNYDVAISCEQYNKQAGTNYACPPNPFTVESALFLLPQTVSREVSQDTITIVGTTAPSKPAEGSLSCENMIINGLENKNLRDVISGILCYFNDSVGESLSEKLTQLRRTL